VHEFQIGFYDDAYIEHWSQYSVHMQWRGS
jgi:hypothetical protein